MMEDKIYAEPTYGINKEYYPNGSLKHEWEVVKYLLVEQSNGSDRWWYDNGVQSDERTFVNGNIHGVWKGFDSDGKFLFSYYFEHGIMEGEINTFQ